MCNNEQGKLDPLASRHLCQALCPYPRRSPSPPNMTLFATKGSNAANGFARPAWNHSSYRFIVISGRGNLIAPSVNLES